jgi:uncharacterized protein YwqG
LITRQDLESAIAECQGNPTPNANTCAQLASFYIIKDHMYGKREEVEPMQYSMANEPTESVEYKGESEFAEAIRGKNTDEVLSIMDELMETLQVLHPKLYAGVMRRL